MGPEWCWECPVNPIRYIRFPHRRQIRFVKAKRCDSSSNLLIKIKWVSGNIRWRSGPHNILTTIWFVKVWKATVLLANSLTDRKTGEKWTAVVVAQTGMCISVYSSCPSFSSKVGSASSASNWEREERQKSQKTALVKHDFENDLLS